MTTYPYEQLHALLSELRAIESLVEDALELCTKPSERLMVRVLPLISTALEVDQWEGES